MQLFSTTLSAGIVCLCVCVCVCVIMAKYGLSSGRLEEINIEVILSTL